MKKGLNFLCLCSAGTVLGSGLTVFNAGRNVLIRSNFSGTQDLVVNVNRIANEDTYLISKDMKLSDGVRSFGPPVHVGIDEYPAIYFSDYGFLSGNHGSAKARKLIIKNSKFTSADLGKVVVGENGTQYRIVGVKNEELLIHPEASGTTVEPGFKPWVDQKLFFENKELSYSRSMATQMYPLNRITKYRWLVNGKTPLPKNREVKCDFLELHFTHDVLLPQAVVDFLKENIGREKKLPEFVSYWKMLLANSAKARKEYADFMKLKSLLTVENVYKFQPGCAAVLHQKITCNSDHRNIFYLGAMFVWSGTMAQKKLEEFYIPKINPVYVAPRNPDDAGFLCDFSKIYRMPETFDVHSFLTPTDAVDKKNLPDRFIKIAGDGRREIGFAIGYSLFSGCTAGGGKAEFRERLFHFWHSKKLYPYAFSLPQFKKGESMELISYKQFFDPAKEPDSTSFYQHYQGKSFIVYLDFHKSLKDKTIQLDKPAAGRKITILEKTPSVTLHTVDAVPADGRISLDVNDAYGYIVLKLD